MARVVDDTRGTQAPPVQAAAAPPAPAVGTSPVGSQRWFAEQILHGLGAPISSQNVAFLLAWMHAEGHGGANNPLNTTSDPNGKATGSMNSVGVKNFANPQDGVQAIVHNLSLGYYTQIKAALVSGDPTAAFSAVSEFGVFSGNANNPAGAAHYVSNIQSYYGRVVGDPSAGLNQMVSGQAGAGGGSLASNSSLRGIPAGILSQYGYLLNDPQVGPILRRASADPTYAGSDQFTLDMQNTDWWKQHSSTARSWLELQNTDPATYQQQHQQYLNEVVATAQQYGVKLTLQQMASLADQAGMNGWQQGDLTRALLGYANPQSGGGIGASEDDVRAMAANYGVRLDDTSAFNYAKQIAEGGGSLDTIKGDFAKQAEALYPHYTQQLQNGLTLRDIAQPYITQAANLLEVSPSTISLADPKFSVPLGFHDGKQVRPMTQYEWSSKIMSDPSYGWSTTQNARDSAVNVVGSLGKWMNETVL